MFRSNNTSSQHQMVLDFARTLPNKIWEFQGQTAELAIQQNCYVIDSSYKGLLYALYFTTAIL